MSFKINRLRNNLDFLINSHNLNRTIKYRKCANLFKMFINEIVKKILLKHNYKLSIEINGVKLSLENSVLNSSTAFGYIVEELIVREIKQSKYSNYFIFPFKTANSVFDIKYKNDKVDLYCNIKVEKNGEYKSGENICPKMSSNNAIASAESLINEYSKCSYKPKLYLITKIPYSIDILESEVILSNTIINTFMESFILKYVKSDGRSWTKGEVKVISGRLQTPSKSKLNNYGIETIPNYNTISKRMCNLEKYLIK